MNQDIIFQLGSLLGRAIPLAMLFVAVAAGWVMLFDAIRIYRNRETKVSSGPARNPESSANIPEKAPIPGGLHQDYGGPSFAKAMEGRQARQAKAPYGYRQTRRSRA